MKGSIIGGELRQLFSPSYYQSGIVSSVTTYGSVWCDMDDTLTDFTKGKLEEALSSMKYPDYYKDLELQRAILSLVRMTEKCLHRPFGIVSGVADTLVSGDYIKCKTLAEYMQYFKRVVQVKVNWLIENVPGRYPMVFTQQSDSKAEKVMDFMGRPLMKKDILFDDNTLYCQDWSVKGGIAVLVKKTEIDGKPVFLLQLFDDGPTNNIVNLSADGYTQHDLVDVINLLFRPEGVKDTPKQDTPKQDESEVKEHTSSSTVSPEEPVTEEAINMVDHPKHYKGKDDPYECIKVIEAWGLEKDFNLGTALRYLCRQGDKVIGNHDEVTAAIEDLKKAEWYIHRRILELNGFQEFRYNDVIKFLERKVASEEKFYKDCAKDSVDDVCYKAVNCLLQCILDEIRNMKV